MSGVRAYGWLHQGKVTPIGIADFLIFDPRMPRSLRFSVSKIRSNLSMLDSEYGGQQICHESAERLDRKLKTGTVEHVFEEGLHEFLTEFLADTARLGQEIETNYRFLE